MAYEGLARKWRPQRFEDVVGQEHVTKTLKNAIETGRIAHAYLFVGPRGIGKTTLARLFAKSLDCAQGPTISPCLECDACREIAAGSSLDVLEIDGASNNSVDDVRALRDQVQFRPATAKYKVVIIDEVHMLSPAAFNALLKTLEEPPSYVVFIFATTEGDKVLPTIVSRCQRFDLRRISTPLIARRLRYICDQEKVVADDDALLAIARGAEGGMRDALSSLDQLIAFRGGTLAENDVLEVFGIVSRKALESLARAVLTGDAKTILEGVRTFDSAGKNLRRLAAELLEFFRDLLVWRVTGGSTDEAASDEQCAAYRELSALAGEGRLERICEELCAADGDLRTSLSVRTRLELALIRCARLATTATIDEVLRKIKALREAPAPVAEPPLPGPAAGPAPNPIVDPALKHALQTFKGRVIGTERD